MKVEIKNVKCWRGMDGEGYSLTLYLDGRRAATVLQEGRGGETRFSWEDDDARSMAAQWVGSLPARPLDEVLAEMRNWGADEEDVAAFTKDHPQGEPRTLDEVVAGLVDDYALNKKLRTWCRTKTVFRLKGDPQGEFRAVKTKFAPAVKRQLLAKYSNNIEEIINERF